MTVYEYYPTLPDVYTTAPDPNSYASVRQCKLALREDLGISCDHTTSLEGFKISP